MLNENDTMVAMYNRLPEARKAPWLLGQLRPLYGKAAPIAQERRNWAEETLQALDPQVYAQYLAWVATVAPADNSSSVEG